MKRVLSAFIGVLALTALAQAEDNVVRIGQIEAQTGPTALYGWMSVQGSALAVHEINEAGGFEVAGQKYKIEMTSRDTRGDPKEAIIHLKRMLDEDHIKFVMGPYLSNVFAVIRPYAEQMNGKFLMLAGASRSHEFLGKPNHEFLVRTWNWITGPNGTGTKLAQYMVQKFNPKKIAMLLPNDESGRISFETYTTVLKDVGVEYIVEYYDPTTKDYTPMLTKLKQDGVEFLVPSTGSESQQIDITRQATEGGYFRKFIAFHGSLAAGLKNRDGIDDYLFAAQKYFEEAEKTDPKVQKFVNAYKAFYKTDFPYSQAPTCSSSCYDTVYMLVAAMQKAGSVDDVAKVREALLTTTHDGVWKMAFDEKGEQIFDFDIVHLKKGGAVEVTKADVVQD